MSTFDKVIVSPAAGPNGFRWFVVGLNYPLHKSGNPGDPITYFGTPTRTKISGPHKTKTEAEAATKAGAR